MVITPEELPIVTVDDLEVAQFVFLLLSNAKLRNVIDTIGKKAVLILGRFTTERKATLDALREELRKRDFVPILFDFEKPDHRDLTETVSTLAHLARFVIADLTDAKIFRRNSSGLSPTCRLSRFNPSSMRHSTSMRCSKTSPATCLSCRPTDMKARRNFWLHWKRAS